MFKNINKEKGITLIALAVTIIVLLILATITMKLILDDKGLIKRTEDASQKWNEASINEQKELNEISNLMDNYINSSIEGSITITNPEWSNEKASVRVSTSTKYQIEYQKNDKTKEWITISNNGIISDLVHNDTIYVRLTDGINKGKTTNKIIKDTEPPVVTVSKGTVESNKITVNVTSFDEQFGMEQSPQYTYYIKKTGESENFYVAKATNVYETSYTFSDLIQNTSYDIKVTVKDKAGNNGEGKITGIVTAELTEGAIKFSDTIWDNGKASVTVSTNTSYQIEYQKNGKEGTWTKISNNGRIGDLIHNDTVYARLTDGINNSDYASVTILDTIYPQNANIEVNNDDLTVKVTHIDNESGVNISKCKWTLNTSSNLIGNNENSYTNVFSSNGETIKLPITAEGTYYLHVLTVDNSGKSKETISSPILYNVGTDTIYYKIDGNTLHLSSTDLGGYLGYSQDKSNPPWVDTSNQSIITKVIFENEIRPLSTAKWFYRLDNLTELGSMIGNQYVANDLSNLNTTSVTDMSYMFSSCGSLTNLDVSKFDTSNVTNMSEMFSGSINLTNLNLSNFNTSNVTDMSSMFAYMEFLTSVDISNFDTSKVTDMYCMFYACHQLISLDISNFDTSNVTNMSHIFSECGSLTSLNVSNFDTSNVTNMSGMFESCGGLTSLDVSNFDTSNVTDMSMMFHSCGKLTSLDLSNFDTSNVTDMISMFEWCDKLKNLDLSNFNTPKLKYVYRMFQYYRGGTLNLSGFDTSSVIDCDEMFQYAETSVLVGDKWNLTESQTDYKGTFDRN